MSFVAEAAGREGLLRYWFRRPEAGPVAEIEESICEAHR